MRFDRLTVTRPHPSHKYAWECYCSCGSVHVVKAGPLKSGRIRSCGCLHSERASEANRTRGGVSVEYRKEYACYNNMVARCTNPSHQRWDQYGARGIRVCDRWLGEFGLVNFLADMGPAPTDIHSLDRIDVNGPYSPENCQWADKRQQARNRTNVTRFEWEGQMLCISEIAEITGIPSNNIWGRISNGWPLDKAATTPIRSKRSHGSGSGARAYRMAYSMA